MNRKQKTDLAYLLWTLLPLAVGGLSSLLSMEGMRENAALPQPALQPPPWVFITAWTILYLLMGLGAGLVWNAYPHGWKDALVPFFAQLALNFIWSPLFFAWKLRLAAFIVLLGMLGVDARFQGQGLGSALLADAIARSLGIADSLGAKALVVDPADDAARSFYERHGFAPIPGSDRLYLPLKL